MFHIFTAFDVYNNLFCVCVTVCKNPALPRSLFHLHFWQLKSLLNAITNDLACSASPQFFCLREATAVWYGWLPSAKCCRAKLAKYCSNLTTCFLVDMRWINSPGEPISHSEDAKMQLKMKWRSASNLSHPLHTEQKRAKETASLW